MSLGSVVYCPVAVTPQLTTKLKVDPVANEASVKPPPVNRFGNNPGHTPAPEAVQLATEQLNPALGVSLTIAPLAAAGPVLANVTV